MKRCLIVDDSRVIRKVARRILEDMKFEIEEAADGMEALHACRRRMPDAILLDWTTPVMSGIAAQSPTAPWALATERLPRLPSPDMTTTRVRPAPPMTRGTVKVSPSPARCTETGPEASPEAGVNRAGSQAYPLGT